MVHDVLRVVYDVSHNHIVLQVFHVLQCLVSRATISIGATDRLRDHGNAAGIGDNSREIGDNCAGIGDITEKVIPC